MSKTAARPKVDLDATRELLERVGLARAAEQLDVLLGEAVKDSVPPHRFLDRLLEEELGHREERRVRTSLKLSGLPTGQTAANFDFSFQPSIERSRIETLATWPVDPGEPHAPDPGTSRRGQEPPRGGARGEGDRARLRRHLLTGSRSSSR